MVNQLKKNKVEELKTILSNSKNFLLVKIDRTTHQNLELLRKQLKKDNSSIKVIKNTLFEKAVNQLTNNKLFLELKKKFLPLKETSAIVTFKNDWSSPLKAIYNFLKKEKSLSFKFALLDEALYQAADVEKIAQLPSRNELLGKVIGSLKAPINRLVYSLKFNTNKLVYILKEKSKK
ncbi:MAG: 50S ribosomal protein L10 [Microgenomates group bacterium]